MAEHRIPKRVTALAQRLGVTPVFVGRDGGADIYDANGAVSSDTPTGLPVMIKDERGQASLVTGTDALLLLGRLP